MPDDTKNTSKKKALAVGATEGAIELVKIIPGTGSLIESVRKYRENIEEQQREQFIRRLEARIEKVEGNSEWYATDQGEQFVKKVVATALNAEYADKLDYLANALVNGPTLGDENARRMKYVEMIRQLSKPALDVLIASLKNPPDTKQVIPERIAQEIDWLPALVSACVQELYAAGAYSNVINWHEQGGRMRPSEQFKVGTPAITEVTLGLVDFIG